jgi:nucleoside-diphosphate-sugar epimerase
MSEERFLVTGAAGCIGVWVLRNLVREKVLVAAFDLDEKQKRL